ncbi:MAG: methylphosphotriester-DNA--protein-cysteine methyltransferase family protein, partial [Legionellales bacterium]|nr:methylphosphotriester-DNA--protein-cysteine methyltransferase family protein [Legionellales bacterium]
MLITEDEARVFYKALIDKNPEYEGIFFVGVKTTGVFCRPTCPARKPKFESCEYYKTAKEALLASFRPCMRCKPLSSPGQASEIINFLIDAIEKNPEKTRTERDYQNLSIDTSTARRHFK